MTRPKFTVLTDPLPWGREILYVVARQISSWVKNFLRFNQSFFTHPRYRGHYAVTRSLVEGLHSIGASFNYNPHYTWKLADTVIVLSGVKTLNQAIRFKQLGLIKKLYAGPNIMVFASDSESLLSSPEVDLVITPSEWIVDLYLEDSPTLKDRIFAWPAGVNTNYWQPDTSLQRSRILVFDKRREDDDPARTGPYIAYLRLLGWHVDVLVRCGVHGYTRDEYRALLQQSCLMLGFTIGSESQGIAWAEAWACDVPTLILRNLSNSYQNRIYHCTTAPYLCSQNGLFFDDLEDFKNQFNYWIKFRDKFTPRKWVLQNMSDEVCANLLYEKVNEC